jgi:hypothetical protein
LPGVTTPAFLSEFLGKVGRIPTKIHFLVKVGYFYFKKSPTNPNRVQNYLTLLPPSNRSEMWEEKKGRWGGYEEGEVGNTEPIACTSVKCKRNAPDMNSYRPFLTPNPRVSSSKLGNPSRYGTVQTELWRRENPVVPRHSVI